jgi:hypothetical protein
MTPRGRCWLDANVLIEANRRSYPYSIAKSFWGTLAGLIDSGRVVSARRVYQELTQNERHQDYVKQWVTVRRKYLCQPSNKDVERLVGEIGAYIFSFQQYDQYECWQFQNGGDPWVVAHAKLDGGVVVTQESKLHPMAKKPMVPDICKKFDVNCKNTLEMFQHLSATF